MYSGMVYTMKATDVNYSPLHPPRVSLKQIELVYRNYGYTLNSFGNCYSVGAPFANNQSGFVDFGGIDSTCHSLRFYGSQRFSWTGSSSEKLDIGDTQIYFIGAPTYR